MTLPLLSEAARRKPIERRLVCPECGGPICLSAGLYWCFSNASTDAGCGQTSFVALADLAPAGREQP